MTIKFAHLREKSTNGGFIDFVVFDGKPIGNLDIALAELTKQVRLSGLKVDQSAFQYVQNKKIYWHGNKELITYLQRMGGITRWTHSI